MYTNYLIKTLIYKHPRISYMIPNKDTYTNKKSIYNAYMIYVIGASFGLYWWSKTNSIISARKRTILNNVL